MSRRNFDQNYNSLIRNQDIQMRESNVNNQLPNVTINLKRRQMNFRVDPNSLITNLMNSGYSEMLNRTKVNLQEQGVIEKIMKNIDELSKKLSQVIKDIQEQFEFLENKLHYYADENNKKVNSNEKVLMI